MISRSGFVYAVSHPNLAGWTKVGFTRRAPSRRAKQLSGSSVPSAFEINHAEFFWDAPKMERFIHTILRHECESDKEFFKIKPDRLHELFSLAQKQDQINPTKPRRRLAKPIDWDGVPDVHWEDTKEGQEQMTDWLVVDRNATTTKKSQDKSDLVLEKHAALGWAQASYELAELWMKDVSKTSFEKARWLFHAAQKQGMPGADVRLKYWSSVVDPTQLDVFWQACQEWMTKLDHPSCPNIIHDTLLAEQSSWPTNPSRAQSWGEWSSRTRRFAP